MNIKLIACSYWRRIKAGARSFSSVPENIKEEVVILAKEDVLNSVITEEEYLGYMNK